MLQAEFDFFFFNDTATTEIYTLSLHDALPIYVRRVDTVERRRPGGVVVPVEWHLAGTRSDAHVRAEVAQPRRDPAAGLACPAKYKCRRHASESTSTRRDSPWLKRSIAFVIV